MPQYSIIRLRKYMKTPIEFHNGLPFSYPNYKKLKYNRLIIMERVNYLCQVCKDLGEQIHHKNGGKINHNLNNLVWVCLKCHRLIHKKYYFPFRKNSS